MEFGIKLFENWTIAEGVKKVKNVTHIRIRIKLTLTRILTSTVERIAFRVISLTLKLFAF